MVGSRGGGSLGVGSRGSLDHCRRWGSRGEGQGVGGGGAGAGPVVFSGRRGGRIAGRPGSEPDVTVRARRGRGRREEGEAGGETTGRHRAHP